MLPYIDTPFEIVGNALGTSVDELKLLSSFLLSYPLAATLKRIPDAKPWQKNVFIITVSVFYLVGLFDLWDGVRTILWSSVGAYAIAYYIDGSLMPWIGFVFLMGHMSINHIIRQNLASPSTVDVTGAQMVLVMKLSAFCWNVHDGRLPQEELTDHQRDRAIIAMPNFLDYAGYILFFPSMFAGPAFDYNDYRKWLETTMFDLPPGVDPAKAPRTRKQRRIPQSHTPATWKALYGLIWIGMFLKFSAWYNTDKVLSDEFMKYSLLGRIWILQMYGFTARLKYYGVWYLTEGACILSGLGYNGIDSKTGKARWDRLENVNPMGVELAQNSRGYLENWNKNTNNWLRNYVYLRVTPKSKKPGFRASLITFTTSAFWHGFYPGYYLTFVLASFIQTVAKNFRRYVRPFFFTPDGTRPTVYKPLYDILSFLATQSAFCFTTAPFVILDLSSSLKVWARVYFYCVIGVVSTMAFFASPAKQYLIKQLNKRKSAAAATTVPPKKEPPRTATTVENEKPIQVGGFSTSIAALEARLRDKYASTPLGTTISNEDDDLSNIEGFGGATRGPGGPGSGVPNDPEKDIEEAIAEIKREVELRRRRGSVSVQVPTGAELRKIVEEKVGYKLG